jgi:TPR repeat protein
MDKQITNKGQSFIDQLNVYQSANSDHQSIKNNFIIRLNEFDIIIESLKNKEAGDSLQNELILGRRGSGKSTLLKRIEIEILENEALNSKFIPINLAEEQAGIYRLFDLWEETLKEISHHLGTQLHLKDFKEFKQEKEQEQEYTRYLYQTIHEICVDQNRKIVLLLDNFDRIVENFTDDGNLLREMLINFNDLAIIAGSTRMDEHFWGYDMPFYEFFRRHRLESLNRNELHKLLNHWSDTLDIPELKIFITNNPGKIENIRLLTDGLPRTIQFFIQMVLQDANSHGYEYLKKIMDNVTPLYQERLNSLPAPLKKIILEMSFIWEACTTKQLVEKCRMESKLVSAHLKTLVDKGLLDKVETSKKNHLYRISERFFNMWLIITQGNPEQKRKAKWLSIFLENWYDANDLKKLAKNHIELLKKTEVNRKDALILSKGLSQCKCITTFERDQIIRLTENLKGKSIERSLLELPQRFEHILDEVQQYINNQDYNSALELAESIENEEDGYKFFLIGEIYFSQDNYTSAMKYLLKAEQKGNKHIYLKLGLIYESKKKYDKAEKCYLKSIENGDEKVEILLAMLYEKQKKYNLAEKYCKSSIEKGDKISYLLLAKNYFEQKKYDLSEKYHLLAIENGNNAALFSLALIYGMQGKNDLAEKYYLLAIEAGNTQALYLLALLYDVQDKFDLAENYYLLAIKDGNTDALFDLATIYDNQNKIDLAEKFYLLAIENENEKAMFNLAFMYDNQEKIELAEKFYLLAIENGDVKSMYNLAILYENLKKEELAEKFFLMAIENGDAESMNNLAVLYENQKKFESAEKYYLMAIENEVNLAASNLSILYYEQNKNKKKSLELLNNVTKNENYIENQKNLLIAEVWNGIFNNLEERIIAIIQKETDNLYDFIFDLLVQQQKTLILKMFNHEEFGKTLQDKYSVLYYTCLLVNNKTEDNLELRIPPEIKPTIDEVLALIDEKQKFYGYKQ